MKLIAVVFRPAFNVQYDVDAVANSVAAVDVGNSGSDMCQMSPIHHHVQQRDSSAPQHWLADGGLTKLESIGEIAASGSLRVLPAPSSRIAKIDPSAPKPTDSLA